MGFDTHQFAVEGFSIKGYAFPNVKKGVQWFVAMPFLQNSSPFKEGEAKFCVSVEFRHSLDLPRWCHWRDDFVKTTGMMAPVVACNVLIAALSHVGCLVVLICMGH